MTNIQEIIAITKNIISSGGLEEGTTFAKFIEMSYLRTFHYSPEKYGIEEHDAKILRSFFHNNSEIDYTPILKPLFNV